MKNFLQILILLVLLTACDNNSEINPNQTAKTPIEILFANKSATVNHLNLDIIKTAKSLRSEQVNNEMIHSIDLESNESGERKLFFKIENNAIRNMLIIEHYQIVGTKNFQFRYLDVNDNILAEHKLIYTKKGYKLNQNTIGTGSCYTDCLKSYTQQCIDAGFITTIGCVISNNFIVAACILHCL